MQLKRPAYAFCAFHAERSPRVAVRRRTVPSLRVAAAPAEALFALAARDQLIVFLRLVWAGLAGAALGAERSRGGSKVVVGARTMSLVSVGAALFTVAGANQ